jgi:hypothetical protein
MTASATVLVQRILLEIARRPAGLGRQFLAVQVGRLDTIGLSHDA